MRRGTLAALMLMLALALGLAAAGPASATTPTKHATWETVAGVFHTQRSAEALIKRLDAKNLKGFAANRERMGRSRTERWFVEHAFSTEEQARAEMRRLQQAGFHGRVERRS